jgi:hypothetical protein
VEERAPQDILGKDGERPALFEMGNHESIVRHKSLHMAGELRQKALRIEGGL